MNTYFIYARKSSEDNNRQINSIDDQIIELRQLAEKRGIKIVDIIQESKSAKKPGRPAFNNMIERIKKGEADGIVCWKFDRLSRNAVDGGEIIWLLQMGKIQHIISHSASYRPTDNLIPLYLELGVANQYIKDLSVNVSRGTRQKAERGWFPSSVLPIGYSHNPDYKKGSSQEEIIIDEERFYIVQRLWKLLITETYTIADLKRKGDLLNLRHRKTNRKLSRTSYHRLFHNPFYAGFFYWRNNNGERTQYKGKHRAMISYEDFIKAQKVLGSFSNPTRVRTEFFAYKGIIQCGVCEHKVTAEDKHQVICTKCKIKYSVKTNPQCRFCGLDYNKMKRPIEIKKRYYHCYKRKTTNCTSSNSIEEKVLESTLQKYLNSCEISEVFFEWATNCVKNSKPEIRLDKLAALRKNLKLIEKKLNSLTEMRMDEEISKEEFTSKAEVLRSESKNISIEIQIQEDKEKNSKPRAIERLKMLNGIQNRFNNLPESGKKELISQLTSNLSLKDKKLHIITPKWILNIKKHENEFMLKNGDFEPKNLLKNIAN